MSAANAKTMIAADALDQLNIACSPISIINPALLRGTHNSLCRSH
jgi:hypothetical protein